MKWKIFNLIGENGRTSYDIGEKTVQLLETNKEQETGTNLKINGKIYHVCMINYTKNEIGVREINFVDLEDVEETVESEFTCPFCVHVYCDAFELSDFGEVD